MKGVTRVHKSTQSEVLLHFTAIRLATVSQAEWELTEYGRCEGKSASRTTLKSACDAGVSKGCCSVAASHRKLGAVFSKILTVLKTRTKIWRRGVGFEPYPPNENVELAKGPKGLKALISLQFSYNLCFACSSCLSRGCCWLDLARLPRSTRPTLKSGDY